MIPVSWTRVNEDDANPKPDSTAKLWSSLEPTLESVKETALQLSLRGAKIYIACRDLTKANQAIDDIKKANPEANITALALDLSSFKSVREFAEELKSRESSIDILINNAGVMMFQESKTGDGFETDIHVNYLSPFPADPTFTASAEEIG